MKVWPSKDPDEVLRYSYDWSPDLAVGETIVSAVVLQVTAAGTTLVGQQITSPFVTLIISGGTDGLEAAYLIRPTTSTGNVFEDTVALPIMSKVVPAMFPGGYTLPTPANLIALFPEFASVGQARLAFYLERAARVVTLDWPEADFGYARMLLAAHLLTGAGLGTSAEATAINDGSGQFRSMRIGSLALERFSPGSSSSGSKFSSTRYGREFLPMLRAIRGGPRVTGDGMLVGWGDGDNFGPWTQ